MSRPVAPRGAFRACALPPLDHAQRTLGADNAPLLPEGRRAIHGRTHAQTWTASAGAHYRAAGSSPAARLARVVLWLVACVAIGLLVGRAL